MTSISGNFTFDKAILDVLPPGVRIQSANRYGSSAWSTTVRIQAETADGTPLPLFMKCISEERGKPQMSGEYRAMSEFYKLLPSMVPKPYGWGQFSNNSDTYFFVCEFINISDRLPDPVQLGVKMAELHASSKSPTGKFGFYVPTYDGEIVQDTTWDDDWPRYFTNSLKHLQQLDWGKNGHWKELDDAFEQTYTKVIPRLLGALEEDGRKIVPRLIHGDLWETNIGTELENGNIKIYDASAYYAHNEMEIGMWRVDHHLMKDKAYRREYLRHMEPDEPVEEWDDRNRLYSCKTTLCNSIAFPGTPVRRKCLEDLEYLVKKYGS